MKILQSFSYSRLLRSVPTLYRLKNGSKNTITNNYFDSNYHLFLCKQKSTLIHNHATPTQDRTKYDHNIRLHTDGLIKTIIKNSRELYHNLRDDFRANWGFNTILVVIMFSYIGVFIGRFKLEYEKAQREEKQMDEKVKLEHEKAQREEKQMYLDHEYKMAELRWREKFDEQRIKVTQSPSSK